MTEEDLINLIKRDPWMVAVLREAEKLRLPNWMVGAGFLRNKVWDFLHGIKREQADTRDIDLIYFDSDKIDEEFDKILSKKMNGVLGPEWEIVNQAYTHKWHNRGPYKNAEEALSEWVETPTCVAVTIENGNLRIIAPHGITDLVNLIVRPAPAFRDNLDLFHSRVTSKKWLEKWPKLRVVLE